MKKANDGAEKCTGAASDPGKKWNSINWSKVEKEVKRLQIRIAEATKCGKMNKVKSLQRILTRSYYAKLLAVKRVTSASGAKTPGIDGIKWKSSSDKMQAVYDLNTAGYKAKPLRRITIPKKNGKTRPLGIPTMKDRAMQALYLLALEPVGETTADTNSYGFRPYRAGRDAICQCFNALAKKNSPRWVLDADIKACFDWIDHEWLMANIPMEKKILKKWLKSGFIEHKRLFPTESGTPQGGIISPLLANMTLDGLEREIKKHTRRSDKVNFIRYADDFCVTAASKEILMEKVIPVIKEFLYIRGLKLSETKTRMVYIEDGFDFLSQNMRKFKGNKLITQPSKESIKRHLKKVRKKISECLGHSPEVLIKQLNPIIRGWCNYHKYVQSGNAFHYCHYQINGYLMKWGLRQNRNKTPKWVRNQYWGRSPTKRNFSCLVTEDNKTRELKLVNAPDIGLFRYIKIKGNSNPYLKSDQEYFRKRESEFNSLKLESKRILPLIYGSP